MEEKEILENSSAFQKETSDIAGIIREKFEVPGAEMNRYSPLALAFMGDSVYEIIVRSIVVQSANRPAGQLNKIKVKFVNAAAQARMIEALEPELTEEETDAYKRGRNAKSYTTAKNQSIADYRKATGLEALCGYLYLKGDMDRLFFLIRKGMDELEYREVIK